MWYTYYQLILLLILHILLRSATYGNSTNLGVGRLAFQFIFLPETNKDSILCFYFLSFKGNVFCVPLLERSVVIWKNKSKLGLKCVLEIMCIFLDVSAFRWNCKNETRLTHTHTHLIVSSCVTPKWDEKAVNLTRSDTSWNSSLCRWISLFSCPREKYLQFCKLPFI